MFMALVALMGGVLNSLGLFTAPAAAPIILNLVLISALVVLRDVLPTPAHALAWGVAVAGVARVVASPYHWIRSGINAVNNCRA